MVIGPYGLLKITFQYDNTGRKCSDNPLKIFLETRNDTDILLSYQSVTSYKCSLKPGNCSWTSLSDKNGKMFEMVKVKVSS